MPANKAIKRMNPVEVHSALAESVGGALAATKALKSSPLKRLPRCVAAIDLMEV